MRASGFVDHARSCRDTPFHRFESDLADSAGAISVKTSVFA